VRSVRIEVHHLSGQESLDDDIERWSDQARLFLVMAVSAVGTVRS
jgi:hypothetical protein